MADNNDKVRLARIELAKRELARRQQASAVPPPESEGLLDTMGRAADTISESIPYAAGLMSPTLGMAQYAGQKMNEASGRLAEPVTEMAGRAGVPGPLAAGLGVAASIAGNPMTYVNPGAGISGRVMKPTVPAARQAAVSAAEHIGIPLRRGEITGSKFSTGLSNLMEKTVLGSGPEDAFTAKQYGALGAEKARLQGKIGNVADTYAVGQQAQRGITKRDTAMAAKRNQMFEAIPEKVNVPLRKSRSVADTLIQEQSKYTPTTRNAEIIAIAEDVQSVEDLLIKGEPNFQQLKRIRETVGNKAEQARQTKEFVKARDFERLKHAIDEDIDTFVSGQTSPEGSLVAKEFSESYKKANAFSGAYKGLFKSDEARTLVNAPPEKVVDMVFKRNNESAIKQFRALAGEEGFIPAKQKFTQELLDSNNVSKELEKYEPGTLRSIYNAQELKELTDYGLAQSVPKTTGNLQGTQGSSRSNISAAQYTGLGAGLLSLLTGNIAGAAAGVGQFLAPGAIARANLHYASGIPASLGRTSQNIGKFGVLGSQSGERRNRISQYIDKVIENRR